MADTVEQVHVWDGADWIPVVRDDCELPISSADGTVTLDSPAENTLEVTADSSKFNGQIQCNTYTTESAAATDSTIDLLSYGIELTVSNQTMHYGGYAFDYSGGTLCGLGASSNYLWSKAANGFAIGADRIAFNSNMAGGATGCAWSMETDGTFVGATGSTIEVSFLKSSRNDVGDAVFDLSDNVGVKLTTDNQFVVRSKGVGPGGDERYLPTNPSSVVLKQDLDDKIQVLTQAEYDAIPLKSAATLYCITD